MEEKNKKPRNSDGMLKYGRKVCKQNNQGSFSAWC
jgi:hypothetical protein